MWINVVTNEVYKLHSEFRAAFPQTSFPKNLTDEIMAGFNVFKVILTPMPAVDYTKNIVEGIPVLVEGEWTQVWNITDATSEEITIRYDQIVNDVLSMRDSLLSDSDWRVVRAQEIGIAMSQDWVDYRQALRDITSHANFPHLEEADWPIKPS